MKLKLVDTCVYAGTNEVVNTLGADSCLIIFKGIGEIKLQHCTTEDGSFVDLETIGTFTESVNKGVFVNLEGAKQFIKVVGADTYSIVLGDTKKDPSNVTPIGEMVGKLYAYSYVDTDDTFLIYTDKKITESGTITIYTPEVDTTYEYVLSKGSLVIEDVDDDGKLTDEDNVVYTPVADNNIEL